jgi:cytochrome c553
MPALAAVLGCWAAGVSAQPAEPDPVLAAKLAPCAVCHGASGNAGAPEVPSLAGQPKQFITTQLVMFREGRRLNPAMNAIVATLSNAEINAMGSYYAAQVLIPAVPAQAEAIAQAGRARTEQLNCVQCHGAALKGQQHIPRLAGQQAEYLRVQLQGFKAQTRFDMDGNMTSAAQALTPADIDSLSAYLSALR